MSEHWKWTHEILDDAVNSDPEGYTKYYLSATLDKKWLSSERAAQLAHKLEATRNGYHLMNCRCSYCYDLKEIVKELLLGETKTEANRK